MRVACLVAAMSRDNDLRFLAPNSGREVLPGLTRLKRAHKRGASPRIALQAETPASLH